MVKTKAMDGEQKEVRSRPADRCTYRRPFRSDFRGCPAFEAVAFKPENLRGESLGLIITCRHLDSGPLDPGFRNGSAYPRCLIGDAAQRQAFARVVASARARRKTPIGLRPPVASL